MDQALAQQLVGCKKIFEVRKDNMLLEINKLIINNHHYLEKPFSFHNLKASWDAFSPAIRDLQTLLTGERVASELTSGTPFSDEKDTSMITDEETCS